MKDNLIAWTKTTMVIVLCVVTVMLILLFDIHVTNEKIFEILSPAISITAAFMGVIIGLTISRGSKDCPKDTSK